MSPLNRVVNKVKRVARRMQNGQSLQAVPVEKPRTVSRTLSAPNSFEQAVTEYTGIISKNTDGHFEPGDVRRTLAYLPALNGYPSKFSVPQGEKVYIHLARNAACPQMKRFQSFIDANSAEKVRLRMRYLIDPVTHRVVSQVNYPEGVTCRNELPEKYSGDGAKYTSRFVLDTSSLAPGLYETRFIDGTGTESSDIYFNVMPKSAATDSLVVILPTSTWQAYNRVGGGSFYSAGVGPKREVSMQRPIPHKYADSLAYITPFLQLLRAESIPYFCVSSENLHDGSIKLSDYKAAAILTHDEYYTDEMYDQVEAFVHQGGRLVVAGGNTMYRKCHRVVNAENGGGFYVNYGEYFADPARKIAKEGERPEEALLGLSYAMGGWPLRRSQGNPSILTPEVEARLTQEQIAAADGYTISNPTHWIYDGLDVSSGDVLGAEAGIMDVEIDGVRLSVDGAINRQKSFYAPEKCDVIATCEIGSKHFSLERVGCLTEADVGLGKVLNFGTVGIVKGLSAEDPNITQMLRNAFNWSMGSIATKKNLTTAIGLDKQQDKNTFDAASIREDTTTIAKYYATIFDHFFADQDLAGKQVIDVGPGMEHYFVDLLIAAKAKVWTLDFSMDVLAKSRERGLYTIGADLRSFPLEVFSQRFDGLFCRGSFNPFWFDNPDVVFERATKFAQMAHSDGWGWVAPYNAPGQFAAIDDTKKSAFIEAQAEAFKAQGYHCHELSEEQRALYRVTRAISHPVFVKNLPLDSL